MEILLVDAMNLAYRSHFALRGLSYEGRPTGMFYGFISTLHRLQKRLNLPVAVCWDRLPGTTHTKSWRSKIFPSYKSKRKITADHKIVQGQLASLVEVTKVLGYPCLQIPGLEADDLMALYVGTSNAKFLLFSKDRDLYQLLEQNRVDILSPSKGKLFERIRQSDIERRFMLKVTHWPQYLALGGDQSDDIHVLPRIGPKNALKLISAGVCANKDWTAQPKSIRKRYPEWRKLWPQVQAAYEVAALPKSPKDARILPWTESFIGLPSLEPFPDRQSRVEQFTKFCAEHGLQEFLGVRRQIVQ